MNFTYTWANAEQTSVNREDEAGNVICIPADPTNHHYKEFLSSGGVAAPYVAPPEPEPLTTEEKIQNAGFILGELEEYLVGKIQQRLND